MPAATVEVAHATLQGVIAFGSAYRLHPRRSRPDDISEADRRGFRRAFPPWFSDSDSETADAARGAATKSGGWRSSGTLSCQSKPMVDEPVCAKAAFASLSTPMTCKLRTRTPSAAFCAANERHLAGVTDGAGGVSNPPTLRSVLSRGRPGGLLTPRFDIANTREMLQRSARRLRVHCQCVHVADLAWIALRFRERFCDCPRTASAITSSA
jgi:hypothetical protein